MKFHIFGSQTFPDIAFKSSPKKGLSITAKGSYLLDYEGLNTITWGDVMERTTPPLKYQRKNQVKAIRRKTKDLRRYWWEVSKGNLLQLAANAAEKKFLNGYFDSCEVDFKDEPRDTTELLKMPALIPQVWVNWIHVDFKAELKKVSHNGSIFSCIMKAAKLL